MTTTAPAPTAPAAVPARSRLSSTPARLRFAMATSVVVSLLIAVVGLGVGLAQSSRLGAVSDRSEQTVDLLSARSNLVSADGTATNSFLIGGLEPANLRAEYDAALKSGSVQLARQAGSAQDSHGRLAQASGALTVYSGLVERARANNRMGYPVGAAYLSQASTGLDTDVLPAVDDAVVHSANQAASDLTALQLTAVVALLLVAAVGYLLLVQRWLARLTKRRVNPPMAIGTVLALLAVVIGLVMFGTTTVHASHVRHTSYRATLGLSQALSLVGEARSDESFTLIKRGSGASYQTSFVTATKAARTQLVRAADATNKDHYLITALDAWLTAHQRIRALDDKGDWDAAVALATSRAEGSPSAAYERLVKLTRAQIAAQSAATRDGFGDHRTATQLVGWLLALAGVAAAVGSWRGIERRLEEYR